MARRYVVSKKAVKPVILPQEVTRLSTRAYVDRWGTEYQVIWNGLKTDPMICDLGRELRRASSQCSTVV